MSEDQVAERTMRLGTRGSKLARWQADWTAERLRELGSEVEIVEITTRGDTQQATTANEFGSVGVFTKEIQQALLGGTIDFAVHSLKDLPTTPVAGLVLAAEPPREDASDALISNKVQSLDELAEGAVVGTGSPRRRSQLLRLRPDLEMRDIRGNVDTRLRKLDEGEYDAILLAAAGLKRLGLADRITQRLPTDLVLPAPGQGALGIECRQNDTEVLKTLATLNDSVTHACVLAERTLLAHVEGGCLAAIGAHAVVENDALQLSATVLSFDGKERLFTKETGALADPESLGHRVGEQLLSQGAERLVQERR